MVSLTLAPATVSCTKSTKNKTYYWCMRGFFLVKKLLLRGNIFMNYELVKISEKIVLQCAALHTCCYFFLVGYYVILYFQWHLCLCSAVWSNAIPTSLRAKHQSYRAWLLNSGHGLTKTHINGYNSMVWFHALVGGLVSLQVLTQGSAKLVFYFYLMNESAAESVSYLQNCAIWRSCCIQMNQDGRIILNFCTVCCGSEN